MRPPSAIFTTDNFRAARSACPGINALANHGILPRGGRNIDLETLRRAVTVGFNIDNIDADPPAGFPRFADAVFDIAITTNVDRNNTKTFDMDTVSRHDYPYGPIECDGSLSRDDFYSGNQVSFNPEIFAETRGVIVEGLANGEGTGNGTEIDLLLAAKARSVRMYDQSKRNQEYFFNGTNLSRTFGTSALYMSVLGDPINGTVNSEYMKILFGTFPRFCSRRRIRFAFPLSHLALSLTRLILARYLRFFG